MTGDTYTSIRNRKQIDKPQLSEDELVEARQLAQRWNTPLLQKLLDDRSFWIQQCAQADCALHHAMASGMTYDDKGKRRKGWAKVKCFWDAMKSAQEDNLKYSFMEQPIKQKMGFLP